MEIIAPCADNSTPYLKTCLHYDETIGVLIEFRELDALMIRPEVFQRLATQLAQYRRTTNDNIHEPSVPIQRRSKRKTSHQKSPDSAANLGTVYLTPHCFFVVGILDFQTKI